MTRPAYPLPASTSSAMTTPREERPTASQVPTPILSRVMLVMAGNLRPLAKVVHGETAFSSGTFRPVTPAQSSALRALRTVPSPVTQARVCRVLRWSPDRAQRWVTFAIVKGELSEEGEWLR